MKNKITSKLLAVKSMLVGIVHMVAGHPVTRADEALQEAVKVHCRRHAEAQYNKMMVSFFADQAAAVDPHVDWNEFAKLKNKWHEHTQDWKVEQSRAEEADARVRAAVSRLATLKSKHA